MEQVQPTIDLLTNMDTLHPDVLLQHAIQPSDYKGGLVFRSAIESIHGKFIASSTTSREGLVKAVLESLLQQSCIADYRQSRSSNRYDFTVVIERNPDYFVALEVKGGEGNSINISERPLWAKEFGVWCYLDGAIKNQPAHGAHSIINRLVNELVKRHKQVDALFFKDILCGTRARPCPKYLGQEDVIASQTAPDIFLFPQHIPLPNAHNPSVHSLKTLRLPALILGLFGVSPDDWEKHVWEVHVKIVALSDNRLQSVTEVWHQSKIVDESISRPWKPSQ